MIYCELDRVFDTVVDTAKIYVSMKTYFRIRIKDNNPDQALVYLHITADGYKRERVNYDLTINVKDWNKETQRLNPAKKENQDINLILDNINSKITAAKTIFRLAEKHLTPSMLVKELKNNMPRVKFTSFFALQLEDEKILLAHGSYKRYKSILEKIIKFDDEVTFLDIDHQWLDKYKKHHLRLGNKLTTVSSNIAGIKKFLGLALKHGIKLRIDLKTIDVGTTRGNRTSLSVFELKRCLSYFESAYINEPHKLVLGYFLFSCMTGLRISDVQNLTRRNFNDDFITFISEKTEIDQTIAINNTCRKIINDCPELFEKKYADQHINDELKVIMKFLKINKHVSFHVGRHTFATLFLRAGGQVERLQKLLGHSDIKQTMIYVHIVQADANSDIGLLDNLLN